MGHASDNVVLSAKAEDEMDTLQHLATMVLDSAALDIHLE